MTDAPFMQLYVADYLGDTMHLTTEQHGAYMLLLMTMWRHGGRLPNDPNKLARIARVSSRRWHMIADDLMAFFDIEGDEISQRRLVREYEKAVSISKKRSASGKRGGEAKALKNNKTRLANAKQMLKHSQRPEAISSTEANASVSPEPEKSAPVACRLPLVSGDDFDVLESDVLEWCEAFPAVDVRQQILAMRAWLNANPNKRKTPRGIKRFIVSWLDREQNRSRGSPPIPPKQHRDSFRQAIRELSGSARNEPDQPDTRHDNTGNGGTDRTGSGTVIDLLAIPGRR